MWEVAPMSIYHWSSIRDIDIEPNLNVVWCIRWMDVVCHRDCHILLRLGTRKSWLAMSCRMILPISWRFVLTWWPGATHGGKAHQCLCEEKGGHRWCFDWPSRLLHWLLPWPLRLLHLPLLDGALLRWPQLLQWFVILIKRISNKILILRCEKLISISQSINKLEYQ